MVLSGVDVARKILFLARESGYKIELDEIKINRFVSDSLFEGSLDEFWQGVPALDAEFEENRKKLEAENKKWRFVSDPEDFDSYNCNLPN